MLICKNCNQPMQNTDAFCPSCGAPNLAAAPTPPPNPMYNNSYVNGWSPANSSSANASNNRSVPACVLGIIAGVFGIMGGLVTVACTSLFGSGVEAFIFILCGSILGLVGACRCLKDAKIGSILELVAFVLIAICGYCFVGADFMSIVAMILFLIGGIIGLVTALSGKNK